MSTNMYAARRGFFTRLTQIAKDHSAWEGIQVGYSDPGNAIMEQSVYGGQSDFEHTGENDAVDGTRRLLDEDAAFWVHVRVVMSPKPERGVEASDERVEEILDMIGYTLAVEPNMCGGQSVARILSGVADYDEYDDGVTSVCSIRIGVESFVDPLDLGG